MTPEKCTSEDHLRAPFGRASFLHGAQRTGPSNSTIDSLEARFRLDSVWAGAGVTIIVCVPALIYGLSDARRADRLAFVAAWAVALAGGGGSLLLPWRRIIASRWREVAFLTWTILDMCIIAGATVADGGPTSPVAALFLIPLVFVGVSYPRWSVLVVSVLTLVSYVVADLVYGLTFGRFMLGLGVLVGVSLMSVWQARNHERRRSELARVSKADPLTGCLNRRGFRDRAEAALGALARFGQPFVLMLIDLDSFKAYNDAYGHAAGDELLCWLTDRVGRELRPTDSLARLGGDEFALLVADVRTQDVAPLAARIHDAIADHAPYCCGIACAPDDGTDIDTLYRVADQALYADKRKLAGRR